ncbi:MAG TPA: hypothetical protein IGR89_16205 [Oscillatoriaceae cyanobacterium M7585_C2015_266]|nr:hypothetical protein [Oscillatoriaceae cyanobacterium M7585_C2015_266]
MAAKSLPPGGKSTCPADLETLIPLLLRDLPDYTNRVIRRSRLQGVDYDMTYVVLAGRAEFEPLALGPGRSNPEISPNTGLRRSARDELRQVFITTLERNYITGKQVQLQHYHWLFFTQTAEGWRLAMMFSRLGTSLPHNILTPPRDSSTGALAMAISLWLRDCYAGAIRF